MKVTKLIINWEEQSIWWSMPWIAVLQYLEVINNSQTKATPTYRWYLTSWTLEDGTILVLGNDYDGDVDAPGQILDISGQDVIYIDNIVPGYSVGTDGAATWLLRNFGWVWGIFPRQGAWSQGK